MNPLELDNVSFMLDGKSLVRRVSFSLAVGAVTVLTGPNGSGKTTCLRLAAGLLKPTGGRVLLGGRPVGEFTRRETARRVTLVPQDTSCAFAFTVREMVTMGRNPHLGRFGVETAHDRQLVETAMRLADVFSLADRRVTELSGGERQRVAVARSLATEADVLLLDEPTSSLDISHALDVWALCRTLADQGKALCVAMHDLNAAKRLADAVVLLGRGEIAAAGPPNAVLSPEVVERVFGVRARTVEPGRGESPFVFERLAAREGMRDEG